MKNPYHQFLRWLHPQRQIKRSLILPLFDADNLLINTHKFSSPQNLRFPIEEFDQLMVKLGKIGQVIMPFVFAPAQTLNRYGDVFRKLGFVPISCPLVVLDKDGPKSGKKDTVDPTLIDFGRKMIPILKRCGLTHLCLGSGDEDFLPLVREAITFGLDIIVVAGNEKSLSSSLTKMACVYKNKQQVILLSNILEQ